MDKGLAVFLIGAIIVGFFFIWTWLVMLVAGGLGHVFGIEALFLGYWEATVVALALWMIGGLFKSNSKKEG